MSLRHAVSKFSQSYILPIFAYPFFYTVFNMKISGRENIKDLKSPYIIVSNHISFYDSFVFRLILNIGQLPIRFMAVKKFDFNFLNFLASVGIVDFIYILFGVFVIEQGRGIDKNLEKAVEIISNGGNVVIYPEGGIMTNDELGRFRLGAAVLAKKTGAKIIPISRRFIRTNKWSRKKFIINIGSSFNIDVNSSPESINGEIFDNIKSLWQFRG